MTLNLNPYKGTRDFYPQDKQILDYILNTFRSVCELYGYQSYDAPILEYEELYYSKSSEEIINDQTFQLTDRSGRRLVVRPEMTPTIARMVAKQINQISFPYRVYSIPNVWRYERAQSGRFREHWQLNVDVFGINNLSAEIELIDLVENIFKSFKATENMFTIKINSRILTDYIFYKDLKLNQEQAQKLYRLIDQKNKIDPKDFNEQAKIIIQDKTKIKNFINILEYKSLKDFNANYQKFEWFKDLQTILSQYKNSVFDLTIVRGFSYYSGIVFEVNDNHPENNRSMMGGGRYDGLLAKFNVKNIPVAGFGIGDATMLNFLKLNNLLPNLDSQPNIALATIDLNLVQIKNALNLLRNEGIKFAVNDLDIRLAKKIKWAADSKIKYLIIIGQKELDTNSFNLKNLQSGQEINLTLKELISELKK